MPLRLAAVDPPRVRLQRRRDGQPDHEVQRDGRNRPTGEAGEKNQNRSHLHTVAGGWLVAMTSWRLRHRRFTAARTKSTLEPPVPEIRPCAPRCADEVPWPRPTGACACQRQDGGRIPGARSQRRHLIVREVDATLARPVPRKAAHVPGRIACEATIIDGDIEDAGEHSQRANHDGARLLRRQV